MMLSNNNNNIQVGARKKSSNSTYPIVKERLKANRAEESDFDKQLYSAQTIDFLPETNSSPTKHISAKLKGQASPRERLNQSV